MPVALTKENGDASRGKAIFTNRDEGHCILCHAIDALEAPFQGDLGPNLSDVHKRLTPAQIRLRIVDYQRVKPGTVMPSYYRINDLYQVSEQFEGRPVLEAQDIEDLIAYLSDHGEQE